MLLSFRWYGQDDPVSLQQIRQIPGMKGIVTALYDVPVGESWPMDRIQHLKQTIENQGLEISVIESVPVHEDVKLGLPSRDRYIENFNQTLRNLAQAGIHTVCHNFMPVFDWTRSVLDFTLPDGSKVLGYEESVIEQMDPRSGSLKLPGWDTSYRQAELAELLSQYRELGEEDLWRNLEYFLQGIIPTAEEVGIKMAIHPDDPPWSVFGLPRIITNRGSLERVVQAYDSPNNGLCICSGSLGANPENNVPEILSHFGRQGKVHFVHARNVKISGYRSFYESGHLSAEGDVDMYAVIKAMHEVGYTGPIRPDHGRMIWGEEGRPGYGLYDRALGAAYLNGLWEAVSKEGADKAPSSMTASGMTASRKAGYNEPNR